MMWYFCLFLFCGCYDLCGVLAGPSLESVLGPNRCVDTTMCPAFAVCRNTTDTYHCTCKQGFLSSNGATHFRDPQVECRDIDECSQDPLLCGPHAICKNQLGRYKCSCSSGFSSPTGDSWGLEKSNRISCADINECLQSGICPEHSECVNSIGSYQCKCQPGFTLNSSICEDIDECAHFNPCPDNAYCHNSFGSYSCVCSTGFELGSENMNFQGSGEMCEDIDECFRNSTLCGPNSICTNTPGQYNCSCLSGFFSSTLWTSEEPETFNCTDIDECFYMCPFNASCTNTPGSYFCTCHPGFASSNGQLNFRGQEVECRDIDECSQDPSPCGPNSVCTNSEASYTCSCSPGFQPKPEGSWEYGNFSCKRVPFKCREDVTPENEWVKLCQMGVAVESKYVSLCEQMNMTFGVLDKVCDKNTSTMSLKEITENFASVLEQTSTWSNFTKEETSSLATVLLESVESITLASLLKPAVNASRTIQTEHLDIESKVINEECLESGGEFNLKAKGDKINIGCSTIEESESTGTMGIAFVSFKGMESVLNESFFQDSKSKRKLKINSHIVGGIMTGERKEGFSRPIIYTLENIEPKRKFERPICVTWSTDKEGGRWKSSGCAVLEATENHTVCSCYQLANLAIIMASEELTMDFSLYVISQLGMTISLLCLALAIATFLLCRSIRSQNTFLHLHLCVCLFLAKLLFLTAVDKTDHQTGCAIIAGFLHYFFLACFFWMLVESVMLFLMVKNLKIVNYFNSRNIKMRHLCAFGYGLPGLVVVISASVYPQGYGMHNHCWLNTEKGFVWSFLGPVCTIITINSVLLTMTLVILRQSLCSVNAEVSKIKDTRLLTFKAFAQLFILGCSWVLGLFQIGPISSVMAYLFTIINSLQGALIFLIHCLLNRQVREEYRKWILGKIKPSSQSQTSGMLLSSIPSTSKSVEREPAGCLCHDDFTHCRETGISVSDDVATFGSCSSLNLQGEISAKSPQDEERC
ncbi:adhesion G protein-coupled receptor E1 [Sorex fumeus]|uniref:adhesion G protein-coupled receptor E1 n=1 Tax=Sorex fumeus TaxID=62283 RepID=UPI0024ACB962|nr:adhesion G protein-coupled receptor E1 [Sorex fumeus]